MEFFLNILFLVIGFAMLVKGADWFVDGAAGIAEKIKIPSLIVGLTIVAFGTSAPELAVSISSAMQGASDLTVGNVVGSNIMNILLILGISALFTALPVQRNSLRLDLPMLIFSSVLFIIFGAFFGNNAQGGVITQWEGIIMFALLICYVAVLVVLALKQRKKAMLEGKELAEEEKEIPKSKFGRWYQKMCDKVWFLFIILLVGLGLVVLGSDWAVTCSKFIATKLGISERIIGLTVVAIGTSLPELVTSVTAAIKGKTDIAVGNIIGSNIFNILMVAGFTAILFPLAFSSSFVIDSCIALGAAVVLSILAYFPGHKIKRWGGVVLLLGCAGYFIYLFLI